MARKSEDYWPEKFSSPRKAASALLSYRLEFGVKPKLYAVEKVGKWWRVFWAGWD